MKRLFHVAALAAIVALAPAHAAGPAGGSEASRLPAGTLVYASLSGIDEVWAQLKQTGLWNLTQKLPQVPQILEAGWKDGIAEFERESGLSFNQVWDLASGGFTVALVDLDLAALEQKKSLPGLIGALDLQGHEQQWESLLQEKILPNLDRDLARDGGKRTESEFLGGKLHTISAEGMDVLFAITYQGKLLVSTRKSLLEDYAKGGPTGSSLKSDPNFAWIQGKLGNSGLIFLYSDFGALWKKVAAFAPNQPNFSEEDKKAFEVLDKIGIASLGAAGYSMSIVQGGVMDRFALGYNSTPTGFVKLMADLKPVPLASIKLAPKDAVLYGGSSMGDPSLLWTQTIDLVKQLIPPKDAAEFDQGLAKFKQETGIDLEKDIIGALSGELGMMVALPELPVALLDNPVVGALGKLNELQVAIYIGAKNPQALDSHLQLALERAKQTSTVETYNGVSYRLVSIPNSPVFPGYAIIGNEIVIGLNVATLKTAIDLSKGGEGLESSERFKAARARLTLKGDTSMSYMDLPGLFTVFGRLGYAWAEKQKAAGEQLPFDLASLPKLEELAALIPPVISTSEISPQGVFVEYYSPIGYMTQLLMSTGATAMADMRKSAVSDAAEATPSDTPDADEDESAVQEDATEDEADESGEDEVPADSAPSPETPGTPGSEKTPMGGPPSASASEAQAAPAAPEGWSLSNSTDTSATYLAGDYQGSASWFRSPYSPYLKLETMVEQVKTSSASLTDFKVVSEGPLSVGALKGQELTYEMGDAANRQRLRLIYLQDGTNLYTLTLQCSVAKCDSYKAAFDSLTQSLH